MKLFGKLAGVEISDRRGADLGRIELGIIKGFATGFLDHVAQCLAFFFEIPLKVGPARAEDVNWFIHSCVNLSHAHRAVILGPGPWMMTSPAQPPMFEVVDHPDDFGLHAVLSAILKLYLEKDTDPPQPPR